MTMIWYQGPNIRHEVNQSEYDNQSSLVDCITFILMLYN